MAFFVQLFANFAGLIYIALIVGAVFYVREIIAARQDLQQSLYSLEREAANSRIGRSILMLALLGLIAGATFILSAVVAPQVAIEEGRVTPTAAFTLPTNTPTPTFQPTPTRTPRPPTPTPGTPTPTIAGSPTTDPKAIQKALLETKDYNGLTGKISRFVQGEVVKPVQIQVVKGGKFPRLGVVDNPEVITPPTK